MSEKSHGRKPQGHAVQEKQAAPKQSLEDMMQSRDADVLKAAASHPGMNEDLALLFLTRRGLPPAALEALSKNGHAMKHRRVIAAIVSHVKTPRHVSLPIARHLYTFELLQIALTPAVPADVKMAVEDAITMRLESISAGERLALAKRGSTRVAAALLLDREPAVMQAALVNPFMTEVWIVKAIMSKDATAALVGEVSHHVKWSLRKEIRIALLKNDMTPLGRVLAFAQSMSAPVLRDVLANSRLSAKVKEYLTKELETRKSYQIS
ncbi:MAG: hypothetical protein ACJ71N_12335 [Terriglobales bacterium]|jgi:hypothetical protein